MEDSEEEQEKPTTAGEANKTQKWLTRKQMFAIALVILGAAVTGVINVGVREYYQPDVRYEEGSWYRDGGTAIISLRVKNYGAADAENLRFTAVFDHAIRTVSLDDPAIRLFGDPNIARDTKVYAGEIDRLVPKQTAVLYFSVSPPSAMATLGTGFIRSMTYKGGHGRTGEPLLPMLSSGMFSFAVSTILLILVLQGYLWLRNRSQEAEIAEREMRCRWIEDRYKDADEKVLTLKKRFKKEEARMNKYMDEAAKRAEELEKRKRQAEQ